MKFAICDDEKKQIGVIANELKSYLAKIKNLDYVITEFDDPFQLLDEIDSGAEFDVVFLDIVMPLIMGTKVAKEIRIKKYPCEIVFITSSTDFAIDAFDLGAIHYILKPIQSQRFDEAMERIINKICNKTVKSVVLKTPISGTQKVETNLIEYIESYRHTQTVYMINGKSFEIKESLNTLLRELTFLCANQFVIPYKGYIVNQNAIKTLGSSEITMQSGAKIPLAKGKFREIKDAYFEYLFNSEKQK